MDYHIGFNDSWAAEEADVPHVSVDERWSFKSLHNVSVAIQMISVDQSELQIAVLKHILVIPVKLLIIKL